MDFSLWMRIVPEISEGRARFWDLMVKLFTGLIATGVVWTGFQTLKTQSRQIAIQQRQLGIQQEQFSEEYRRKFWDTKLGLYGQLLRKLADLYASATNAGEFGKKNLELMAFFFSDLQLVASPDVNTAFRDAIRATQSYQGGHGDSGDVFNALTRLAIATRQGIAP